VDETKKAARNAAEVEKETIKAGKQLYFYAEKFL